MESALQASYLLTYGEVVVGVSTTAVQTAKGVLTFPSDFWWGAATAAYQIEGSVDADGRTPSIWDTFSAQPGRVDNGDTGARTTGHYLRYRDDVALMRQLGLSAYRFSIAWPRVRPAGGTGVNEAGLGFYDRLVDELLAAGVRPTATLYHWDLPQELEDAGGWTNRDTALHFGDYAAAVAARLGDRVALWNTLNEPWCSAFLGYGTGAHAPGRRGHLNALVATHPLLLAHGQGVAALRSAGVTGQVSVALNAGAVRPFTDAPADLDAARRIDGLLNRIFFDPILRGSYPADTVADIADITDMSYVRSGDLEVVSQPVDAVCVNYYQPDLVSAATDGTLDEGTPYPTAQHVRFHPTPGPVTHMGWSVDPTGLRDLLLRIRRDYGDRPLYVTENGAAYDDRLTPDGAIHDPERIAYLQGHLAAVHEAITAGVDLCGYFAWSLLDNFEWAFGFSRRFGLIHVNYDSLARTVKSSGHWFAAAIARNAIDAP